MLVAKKSTRLLGSLLRPLYKVLSGDFLVRLAYTLLLCFGFVFVVALGHMYCAIGVLGLITIAYYELNALHDRLFTFAQMSDDEALGSDFNPSASPEHRSTRAVLREAVEFRLDNGNLVIEKGNCANSFSRVSTVYESTPRSVTKEIPNVHMDNFGDVCYKREHSSNGSEYLQDKYDEVRDGNFHRVSAQTHEKSFNVYEKDVHAPHKVGRVKGKTIYFFSKTHDVLSFISLETYFLIVTFLGICVPWVIPRMIDTNQFIRSLCKLSLKYHYLATFIFALMGIIKFILSIEKGKYKQHFLKLAFIIISLLYVVSQPLMIISNIYFGMIWLILPHCLIVLNDCFAYLFGRILGKKPLIVISPNKTVEGFLYSSFFTIIVAMLVTPYILKIKPLLCSANKFTFVPFMYLRTGCRVPYAYGTFTFPTIRGYTLTVDKMYIHVFILSLFASLFAPFGGFLASGFKRALKIKDFSDFIPGHGGILDRFDCHILMGSFTYLYLKTFVRKTYPNVEDVFKMVIKLQRSDQVAVLDKINELLET